MAVVRVGLASTCSICGSPFAPNVNIQSLPFEMRQFRFQAATARPLNHVGALPPSTHEFVRCEYPHLRLRGNERSLRDGGPLLAELLSEEIQSSFITNSSTSATLNAWLRKLESPPITPAHTVPLTVPTERSCRGAYRRKRYGSVSLSSASMGARVMSFRRTVEHVELGRAIPVPGNR